MVRQSQDILDIVAKQTGMKIEAFVGSDYNGTVEALRNGHVDVALLGPFSYILATTQAPVEAFAVTVIAKTMQPSYKSIIITKKDSPITSIQTLKGHTYAFVDPGSTSGYMVPSAEFKIGYYGRVAAPIGSTRAYVLSHSVDVAWRWRPRRRHARLRHRAL